jgi:hypothetical protein
MVSDWLLLSKPIFQKKQSILKLIYIYIYIQILVSSFQLPLTEHVDILAMSSSHTTIQPTVVTSTTARATVDRTVA